MQAISGNASERRGKIKGGLREDYFWPKDEEQGLTRLTFALHRLGYDGVHDTQRKWSTRAVMSAFSISSSSSSRYSTLNTVYQDRLYLHGRARFHTCKGPLKHVSITCTCCIGTFAASCTMRPLPGADSAHAPYRIHTAIGKIRHSCDWTCLLRPEVQRIRVRWGCERISRNRTSQPRQPHGSRPFRTLKMFLISSMALCLPIGEITGRVNEIPLPGLTRTCIT